MTARPRSPSKRSSAKPNSSLGRVRSKIPSAIAPASVEARLPETAETLTEALARSGYLADRAAALSLFLAVRMSKPLLIEGPAGVGKTDLARAAGEALGRKVIRLQCYEGLDETKALYEWDYAKQMLYVQLLRDAGQARRGSAKGASSLEAIERTASVLFDRRFLIPRPLLSALISETPVVLLIDEVDRAEPEFEALLLEILSELRVTIPELGPFSATHPPLILLTTNGSREMTEALRRRCLHAFFDYPSPTRELAILEARLPEMDAKLAGAVVDFAQALRRLDLRKKPSISESLDYARSLLVLGARHLDPDLVRETLGVLLKHEADRTEVSRRLETLLSSGPPS